MNCYPFIEAEEAGNHNVTRACALLKVSRSAYYTDRSSTGSTHARRDTELISQIIAIHDESKQTYGSPRIHHELREQGQRCSRKRVARLMRQTGRYGLTPRRWNKTTIVDPSATHRPDLIGRDFTIDPAAPTGCIMFGLINPPVCPLHCLPRCCRAVDGRAGKGPSSVRKTARSSRFASPGRRSGAASGNWTT